MAPTLFEGAFGNVHLIAKTRAALEASRDKDWCRQPVSGLQLLEAVLCQLKDLSPTTTSDETTRIVGLYGLAHAPLLDCFLQELEKLQPDLDHYFVTGEDKPDVGGPPLWATAVERNTTTLMTSVGMQLQLTHALLRVESLRIITTRNEVQQISKTSPDLLSPATATKVPSQQYIMAGNENVYHGIHIGGSVRAHLGNSYSYIGVPKASIDEFSGKLAELATARQNDALQSILQEVQKKQSDGYDVLSALDARTQQFFDQLGKVFDAITNEPPRPRMDAKSNRPQRTTQKRLKANSLKDLSSILEIIRIWLSSMIMMLLIGSRSVQRLIRSARTLTRSPSMLLDSNIRIVDALNREFSLPYEHFRYWPVMLARLQCEFRGLPGESHISKNKFGLFRAAKQPQNQVMIPFEQWERSVFPGDRVLMSIDLEHFDPNECPSCGCALRDMHLVPVFSKCDGCGQSVLTVRNDLTDKVLRASGAYGPNDQHHPLRIPVEVKDFQRFARVHGRHIERHPEVPTVLDLTEENLALLEDSFLQGKNGYSALRRPGARALCGSATSSWTGPVDTRPTPIG